MIYLMCPPEHFTVDYVINPWMDVETPVDRELALKQWDDLRRAVEDLGHVVHVLPAMPGLPDMVFAANGAFSVDGVVYGAKFRYPQRAAEADAHRAFYELAPDWRFVSPTQVNEGEGDFAYVPGRGLILAGYGFRTEPAAHAEAQEVLGRQVLSLRLVDPRFYHLDTALAVLDEHRITYYPGAFSESSQRLLASLFPDAVLADEADALAFALNLVSDGKNVLINADSVAYGEKLSAAGFRPVLVELGELKRGGGSIKCCINELRQAV
ncbi:N-dimethylarginine dimethylaminohydrolase [Allocatelliglobosispora scoriae]|uniref:N-dimethylarginine dimethylaminohydrolase n=2 Tax=Allocatelliglobosispora scoriae TaxID=643052 RepID=A0A841BU14_9ACTN|nr:N-dimethylarginine dimethylaminohydrolase [Allocatelliglobosispora scoriae]